MSEPKHTSAPWQRRGQQVYGPDGERRVADCRTVLPDPRNENTANAVLVRAAPELLAACEAVKLAIETSSFDRYAGAALEPAYRQLLAAIARTRGEST